MKPSTFLTAGEAARATGKTVPTITRAIKSGRIQGGVRKGENGEYQIDPSALFNIYPPLDQEKGLNSNATPQTQGGATPLLDAAYTTAIDALKETIAAKEALINEKEEVINDYKTRLAKSENLLTDQRSEADKAREKLVQSEALLTTQRSEVEKIKEYEKKLAKSEQLLREQQESLAKVEADLKRAQDEKPSRRWWQLWR